MAKLLLDILATLAVICASILLANFGVKKRPSILAGLPVELLHATIEYLDYEDWLVLYESMEEDAYRLRNAVVRKMTILPAHIGKPIPRTVISVHVSEQQTVRDTASVVSRLKKVLGTANVKSISLFDIPIDGSLLGLIYHHEKSLERLSIVINDHVGPSALRRGWIRRLKSLKALKFWDCHLPSIVFPSDFESLKRLTCLDFSMPGLPLPHNAFQHLGGLRYLKLQLYSIQVDILRPLAKLSVLDLEKQTVSIFDSGILEGLTDLRRLILPHALLQYHINPDVFSLLKKLTSIKFTVGEGSDENSEPISTLKRELERIGFTLDAEKREFVRPEQIEHMVAQI